MVRCVGASSIMGGRPWRGCQVCQPRLHSLDRARPIQWCEAGPENTRPIIRGAVEVFPRTFWSPLGFVSLSFFDTTGKKRTSIWLEGLESRVEAEYSTALASNRPDTTVHWTRCGNSPRGEPEGLLADCTALPTRPCFWGFSAEITLCTLYFTGVG